MTSIMTSPEKEGDNRLRFVFGNGVVKTQIQQIMPDDAEPHESAKSCSTEMLCLRRSNLKQVPDTVLSNSSLTYLCLEGNQIASIPDSLFVSLPKLEWLDLRKNQITSLPAEIGFHRSLRTLALEGNPISELPPELGNVTTLRALCLRNCPIRFPPQDVVHQGYKSILQYLRSVLAERTVNTRTSPAVEKLQLSELIESNMEEQEEESVDEDEMKKFRELKDKFIQLEIAELASAAHSDNKPKSQLPVAPKSQQTLQKRCTQAKMTKDKKMSEHKQKRRERQRKPEETTSKPSSKDRSGTFQGPTCAICTETEEGRYACELQHHIHARAERIQERQRNPRGTMAEQMAVTKEDVEDMRKLREQLLERKRNQGTRCKRCFYNFTDPWQSLFS
ncbi:leucine-rich repeat-containing protein 27-like [Melanotaenia boesemani]|uniref:leucine-rich repeat-containing protein 27-like n=1 Tax=Melanotaenia boesemani TaxID=1250792 RepID=UPI001C044D99|nr:leucine-rich repeat-containing protein 27-like [Melanotaenia boesemani]